MEWWVCLLLFLIALMLLITFGLPVSLSFIVVNLAASILLFGFNNGPQMLIRSMFSGLSSFTLIPIAFFVLMGEVLFLSGIAAQSMDAIGIWIGAIPGRLAILVLITGTILAALSGSALATTAMLGSLMVPQMISRGYSKNISCSSILAAGGLAMIIPPSNVAIVVGTIGNVSIAKLLVAGIVPGVLLSIFYISYIVIKCILNPLEAPKYKVENVPLKIRLIILFRDILPLTSLMFLTVGSILVGIATPSEAAALGAVGAFILTMFYRKLNISIILNSFKGSIKVSAMLLLIMAVAGGFSQFLTFTGATKELTNLIIGLETTPLLIVTSMILLVVLMGCFLEQVAILMIVVPIFMPIIKALGFDPVWFGLLLLLTVNQANLTPPFGLALFVLKGVSPDDFTMQNIVFGAMPIIIIQTFLIVLIILFPTLGVGLPNLFIR